MKEFSVYKILLIFILSYFSDEKNAIKRLNLWRTMNRLTTASLE